MHPKRRRTHTARHTPPVNHLLAVFARVRPLVVLLGLFAGVGLLLLSLPSAVLGVLTLTGGLVAGLLIACTVPFAVVRLVVAGLDTAAAGVDHDRHRQD
ncbi:hypothetical protein [Salinirubrum litoreum]|uniref:Uncharacterized protein n=1 Tax=Salinirubrum litoreum TaxID=1126234 RepID=A0ABD5R6B2_9EURY|nr:hypothetical protein [Salinirubrum litoreum]